MTTFCDTIIVRNLRQTILAVLIGSDRRPIVFWGGAPREITRLGTASRRARTQESSRGGADRLVRRCLILARGVPSAQINDTVRHLHLLDARIDLLLHDFDDPGRNERILAGRP